MINRIFSFIKYKLNAVNQHGIHSPFLYNFYNETIGDQKQFYAFEEIRLIKKDLSKLETKINVTDLGAGSKKDNSQQRKVSDIARLAATSTVYGEILFRMVELLKPKVVIELGTSVGIGTLYLQSALSNAIHTVEGCPEIAKVAKKTFERTKLPHLPIQYIGNIDEHLPSILKTQGRVDFIYIDANHTYEATIRYFEMCLAYSTDETVFVFDDIHWSDGMEKAWQEIKNHPKTTVTLDLYRMGIVFFRKEQLKQHFCCKV